jgi:hypothetical protein
MRQENLNRNVRRAAGREAPRWRMCKPIGAKRSEKVSRRAGK